MESYKELVDFIDDNEDRFLSEVYSEEFGSLLSVVHRGNALNIEYDDSLGCICSASISIDKAVDWRNKLMKESENK